MPFLPTPDGIKVVVNQSLAQQEVVNVLHVRATGAHDQAALASIAAAVRDIWASALMPNLSSQLQLLNVTATDIEVEGGAQAVAVPAEAEFGGQTGDPLPNNCALVVTLRTARVGRSYRGRVYLAGLSETLTIGNNVTQAMATNVQNAFNQLAVGLEALGAGLAVLSRRNQGQPRAAGVLTLVTAVEVRNTRVDSQRRRLPRD